MFSMAETPTEEEQRMDNGNNEDGDKREVEETANGDRKVQNITIKVVRGKGSSSRSFSFCQADECGVDLSMAKGYNRRHKVCERHAKAPVVLLSSIRRRFCKQCSKFHELAQFDGTKRSCRERLAGHNERRRRAYAGQSSGGEH